MSVFMSMSGASGFRHNVRQKTARLQGGPRCCNIYPPFSTDFEKAVWSALRQTLPGVQLKGCSFHWTQALWRKVQSQTVKSLIGQTKIGNDSLYSSYS